MAEVQSLFGDPAPLVFVTGPMTRLSARERSSMSFLARTITRAVDEATREAAEPWLARVYVPFEHSAPWMDDKTPAEVFELIEGLFSQQVDALILLGHDGGSLGCGQELAWACARGIPVLFLHHADEPVTRQVKGATSVHPIMLGEYRDARGLESQVHAFMTRHRSWLTSAQHRREERCMRLTPKSEALRSAWKRLDVGQREAVADTLRLPRARLSQLVRDPHRLAWMSYDEVLRLELALAEYAEAPAPAAESLLLPGELAQLEAAADEGSWSREETLGTLAFVCEQRANEAIRRLPLDSPEVWERMRHAWARQR